MSTHTIISINELRRKFGDIEKALPDVDEIVITKKGKPFAILKATPAIKKEKMNKLAGLWKGTEVDNDTFWEDILDR